MAKDKRNFKKQGYAIHSDSNQKQTIKFSHDFAKETEAIHDAAQLYPTVAKTIL